MSKGVIKIHPPFTILQLRLGTLAVIFITLYLFLREGLLVLAELLNERVLVFLDIDLPLLAYGLIFYIVFAFLLWRQWHNIYFEIMPGKIITHKGFLFKKQELISLATYDNIVLEKGLMGSLLNYGSLKLDSSAVLETKHLSYLPDPENVINLLDKAKEG